VSKLLGVDALHALSLPLKGQVFLQNLLL
jgi:hypothetical protein